MTRRGFQKICNIPKVSRCISIEYVMSNKQTYAKGFENDILPPLSDLNVMNVNMEDFKNVGVIFNGKYFFDRSDVVFSKRIHEMISIKEEIKNDTDWFKQVKRGLNCPKGLSFPYESSLDIFETILLDHQIEKKLNSDERLLSSDARLLVGNNWLNLNIIQHFLNFINILCTNKICVALAELECWERSGELGEKIKTWTDSGVRKICVIANAGRKLGNTFFANQFITGNHWVCFSLELESKEILYCDSLAWSAPKEFPENISFFLSAFGRTEHFKVVYAHKNEVPPTKVHRCKHGKCLMVPYQGPNMNICGLASLVTALVLTQTDTLPR